MAPKKTPNKTTPTKKTPAKKTPSKTQPTNKTPNKKTPAKKTGTKPTKPTTTTKPKNITGPYANLNAKPTQHHEPPTPTPTPQPETTTHETIIEKPTWRNRLITIIKRNPPQI